ncbi:MAG: hypothetical protein E6G40_13300 [Actinobacteria bacterium]|nr:MAG: hypothetical protein E6G40_13300 [Actinomycetota bacterium]
MLPERLSVVGPEELDAAAKEIDIGVMGAHSGGARTLARIVMDGCGKLPVIVGIAKGLEPETLKPMSQVYAEEVGHERIVSVGGPCLAGEIAQGLPTAAVFASSPVATAKEAGACFRSKAFHVSVTDDLAGVEYCTVGKNVAAIGVGILDGMAKVAPGLRRAGRAGRGHGWPGGNGERPGRARRRAGHQPRRPQPPARRAAG